MMRENIKMLIYLNALTNKIGSNFLDFKKAVHKLIKQFIEQNNLVINN